MRSRPTRLKTWMVAGLVVGASASCSLIGTDSEPRAIDDLPDDLFSTTTSTSAPDEEPQFDFPLYFYTTDGGLVRFDRQVDDEPSVQGALDALASGPNEEEAGQEESSVSSRFVQDMNPAGLVTDGVLEVVVEGTRLRELTTGEDTTRVRQIYTQIVCTMHALDLNINTEEIEGVDLVTITDEEGPILVNTAGGEVIGRAVGPEDFNNCKTAEQLAAEAAEAGENGEEGEDETENGSGLPSSPTTARNPTTSGGAS